MKKVVLLFVFLLCFAASYAQQETDSTAVVSLDSAAQAIEDEEQKEFAGSNDTSFVHSKAFDEQQIQKLKSDPDLHYKQPPTVAENLWTRFKRWIGDLLASLFRGAIGTNWGRLVLIVLGLTVMVVIIMLVLKVDAFKVFYSGADQRKVNAKVFHENIHEMDFEKLIREASEKGEYRLGIRLIFLYALKTLADKHLIEWHVGKTNHDYVDEVKKAELKTGLNELSFYFDYAWYGGFTISREVFQKTEGIFNLWKDKVN